MKQPTLADFGLTESLVEDARRSHDKEEKLFGRLCIGWVLFCIAIGLIMSYHNSTKRFGMIQWGCLGFFIGVGTIWFMAGTVLPFLMPRVFPYHRFYTPLLRKHYEFTEAFKKYEQFLERERIRLWREEETRKKETEEYWFQMDGHAFEHEFARLLRAIGWRTQVTPRSDDGGIDIYAERGGKRVGIQCKAHKNPVGPAIVRELHGAAVAARCDSSILVALGGVTAGARAFAREQAIEIWTVSDVVRLHQISQNNKQAEQP